MQDKNLHLKFLEVIRSKLLAKYFLVGGFNTVFGYLATVSLYYSLEHKFHIIIIGVIANVICITESFLTYKFLVFKSTDSWIYEYFRCYAVYGVSIVLGLLGIWVLVDLMSVPFWLAQAGLLIVSVTVSFFGHKNFTFKDNNGKEKIN